MLKLPNGGDDDDDSGGDDYSELKQRRSVERRMSTVRGLFFLFWTMVSHKVVEKSSL